MLEKAVAFNCQGKFFWTKILTLAKKTFIELIFLRIQVIIMLLKYYRKCHLPYIFILRQFFTYFLKKQTPKVGKVDKVKNNVKNFDMFLFGFDSEIRNG